MLFAPLKLSYIIHSSDYALSAFGRDDVSAPSRRAFHVRKSAAPLKMSRMPLKTKDCEIRRIIRWPINNRNFGLGMNFALF